MTNPKAPGAIEASLADPKTTGPAASTDQVVNMGTVSQLPMEAILDARKGPDHPDNRSPSRLSEAGTPAAAKVPAEAAAPQSSDLSKWQESARAPLRAYGGGILSRSPLKLLKKLAAIMADLNWVEKRGRNEHFGYDYATESDILAAIRPRLADKGIFVQTLVVDERAEPSGATTSKGAPILRHRVELLHIFHDSDSGEQMEVRGIGYSLDDGDKGFYKAYTGAVKYAFAKTFLVSTGDDPETGTPEEREAARKAKKEAKAAHGGGNQGPRRSGNMTDVPEGGIFTVEAAVGDYEKKPISGNRTQFRFRIPNVGDASTINKDLAEKLIREQGTGLLIRWHLKRAGSFINLEGAEILPPGQAS